MAPSTVTDDLPRATAVRDGGFPAPLHSLARLAIVVTAEVTEVAERHGITMMQARLLGLLAEGPCRMAELAQGLGVERAAMTGLVDRAVSRDLVERAAVDGDRRSIHVRATATGRAASTAYYAEVTLALDALIAALPEAERAGFVAGAERILTAPVPSRK